jgi:hypothetical protein
MRSTGVKIMNHKDIIKEIIQIANECDSIGNYTVSNSLTRIAQKIVIADANDNIVDNHLDEIIEIAYKIMAERGIEDMDIPDDILVQATADFMTNYQPKPIGY